MKLKNKGASTIFSGTIMLVLSVIVMITIISLVIPFFNGINDSIRYNENKKNILYLNQEFQEFSKLDINSYHQLQIKTKEEINFDHKQNKIIITQPLKNNLMNKFKDQNIQNITITKKNDNIIFTLDLKDIVTLNQSIILNHDNDLIIEKNNLSFIDIKILNREREIYDANEKNKYSSSLILDLNFLKGNDFDQSAEKNNTIVKDIVFDEEGANFNGVSSKIKVDKDLMLGVNDFTIEMLVDNNYSGYLFSKTARIGGIDIFVDKDKKINTYAQGIEIPTNILSINVDDKYIYYVDSFFRLVKLNKHDYSYVKHIGSPLTSGGYNEFYTPQQIAIYDDLIYLIEYGTSSYSDLKVFTKDLELVKKYRITRSTTSIEGLSYPRGVAVDENYIYISDTENHRIMVRKKEDFSYVMHYGGYAAGNGQEQLNTPREIAVDDKYLYIADSVNHRIMIRDKTNLNFVLQLGTGTASTVSTNFNTPYGVDVDKDYLYVAEYGNNRIKKYEKETWNLLSLRPATGGGSGYDFNRFINPTSVAVDPEGYIFVADYSNHRIVKSDNNLNFISRFPDNQVNLRWVDEENLLAPYGIEYDDGYLYISDYGNHRIIKKRADNYETVAMFGLNTLAATSAITGVNGPYDLTVDGDYLYVVEYGNRRILILNKSDLSYYDSFGSASCVADATDEGFCNPRGIAIDEEYIYIADYRNHRVKKHLKSDYSFVAKTTGSNYSSYGCGLDQHYYPTGIAVDDKYVYVTDNTCHRIKVLDKDNLSFVTWYGWDYATSPTEAFNTPFLMKLDGDYLYVVDYSNHRIKKINKNTFFLSDTYTFGSYGYMPSELYNPIGIAISPDKIYVTDYMNRRIVSYDKEIFEQEVLITGAKYDNNNFSPMNNNQFNTPMAVACDSDYLYVTDYANQRLVKLNIETGEADSVSGRPYLTSVTLTRPQDYYNPNGIAVDENYIYYTDYSAHYLTKRNKEDLTKIIAIGGSGSGNNNFSYPRGVAVDDQFVYVADTSNHRIKVHKKEDLSFVAAFGTLGTGTTNFNNPYDVAVDEQYIYVAEYSNSRIKIHNKQAPYSFVGMFGSSGTGDANNFRYTMGVAVDDSYIYVSDYSNHRVVKYDKITYEYLGKFGGNSYSDADDMFYNPGRLSICNGLLYVPDIYNHRIKVLDTNLNYVKTYGERSFGENQYLSPRGVSIDNEYIYIADTGNHSIVKRKKDDFSFVARLGGPILGNANDKFYNPYSIATDGTYVYVAETSYHRIKKLLASNFSFVNSVGGTSSGLGENQFNSPYGISMYDDKLYIADYSSASIKIHNKNDLSFILRDYGVGHKYHTPYGVVSDDDYIYVAEYTPISIKKIKKSDYSLVAEKKRYDDTLFIGKYFTQTYNEYTAGSPMGLAVDDKYLYVVDYGGHKVIVFDKKDLSYVGKIGTYGQGPLNFYSPVEIAVDNDYIYVSELNNHRVVRRKKTDMLVENEGYSSGYNYLPFSFSSVSGVNENTPTHVIIQRKGKDLCYYINGKKDNCIDVSVYANAFNLDTKTWMLSVGSKDDLTNANGSMQFFKIYKRSFSDKEISELFEEIKNNNNNILKNTRDLTNDLVSYYNLDDASGIVIDSTGNKNGTIVENTLQNQKGKIGESYFFDGSGDYIDLGNNTIVGDVDFTLSAWIKPSVLNKNMFAVAIGGVSNYTSGYIGTVASASYGVNNDMHYSIGGGFWGFPVGTGVKETNDWTFIVMVYDSVTKTIVIYINGEQSVITRNVNLNLLPTATRIGRASTSGSYDFYGYIDEVGIWKRKLTPEEVFTLYNDGSGLTYPFSS